MYNTAAGGLKRSMGALFSMLTTYLWKTWKILFPPAGTTEEFMTGGCGGTIKQPFTVRRIASTIPGFVTQLTTEIKLLKSAA